MCVTHELYLIVDFFLNGLLVVSGSSPAVTSNWAVCCTLNPPLLSPIPPEGVMYGCLLVFIALETGVASSWIYAAMAGVTCWLISGAGGVIISGVGKASDGEANGLKSASRLKSGWPGLAPCQSVSKSCATWLKHISDVVASPVIDNSPETIAKVV
nr:hypothetical protein [Tanacetum cinerariifolium]